MADNKKAIFEDMMKWAQHVDRLHLELTQKMNGERALEPASSLDRLLKEVHSLQNGMSAEINGLKKGNLQMRKTIAMVKATLAIKRTQLSEIKAKIQEYTVIDDSDSTEATHTIENKNLTRDKEIKSERRLEESVKKSCTPARTPLQSVENTREHQSENVDVHVELPKGQPSTPPRNAVAVEEMVTPKLIDYLSLEGRYGMYSMLDAEKLITKSSKKSTLKKSTSSPDLMASALKKSATRSRKTLILSTPGNKSVLAEELPPTPVLPQLQALKRPIFFKLPKQDFTGRIAMIDVEEFHSQLDDYLKQIVTLELVNRVINSVDRMFELTPEPVEREVLCNLIHPLAGLKTKLCISILCKLNRLRSVPEADGKDMLIAVHGTQS